MKRDWGVVRQLLRSLESDSTVRRIQRPHVKGLKEHLLAMEFDRLVTTGLDGPTFEADKITQKGKDLLVEMGNDAKWEKIKRLADKRDIDLTEGSIRMFSRAIG